MVDEKGGSKLIEIADGQGAFLDFVPAEEEDLDLVWSANPSR